MAKKDKYENKTKPNPGKCSWSIEYTYMWRVQHCKLTFVSGEVSGGWRLWEDKDKDESNHDSEDKDEDESVHNSEYEDEDESNHDSKDVDKDESITRCVYSSFIRPMNFCELIIFAGSSSPTSLTYEAVKGSHECGSDEVMMILKIGLEIWRCLLPIEVIHSQVSFMTIRCSFIFVSSSVTVWKRFQDPMADWFGSDPADIFGDKVYRWWLVEYNLFYWLQGRAHNLLQWNRRYGVCQWY